MKKLVIIASLFIFLISCESRKGSWTSEDKDKARVDIENSIKVNGEEPESYGDVIDCTVSRLEIYYENYEEAQFEEEGFTKIFGECMWKQLKNNINNNESDSENQSEIDGPGC